MEEKIKQFVGVFYEKEIPVFSQVQHCCFSNINNGFRKKSIFFSSSRIETEWKPKKKVQKNQNLSLGSQGWVEWLAGWLGFGIQQKEPTTSIIDQLQKKNLFRKKFPKFGDEMKNFSIIFNSPTNLTQPRRQPNTEHYHHHHHHQSIVIQESNSVMHLYGKIQFI